MSVIDICILVFLGFGFLLGFKRGFTRQLVSLVGIFAIVILSYIFKNPVSVFLYNNFPFFNFGGIFKDITVLNILVYEIIAFIIVFLALSIVLVILLRITKIFEKLLTMTIILGIPSKLLGGLLGIIQNIIYSFIILYILTIPTLNINITKNSKVANIILTKTPFIHNICDKSLDIYNEIIDLKDEYNSTYDIKEFNQKTLCVMIDKNIITKENANKLINSNKIKNIKIEACQQM